MIVTGLGVVSPLGNNIADYWSALLHSPCEPKVAEELPDKAAPNRLCYMVPERSANPLVDGSRTTAYALAAARQALLQAGLLDDSGRMSKLVKKGRMGVIVGSGLGANDVLEAARLRSREYLPGQQLIYESAARIASTFGIDGPNHTVSTACSSGLYAFGLARDVILSGEADVMLVGGCESLSRASMTCFYRLRAIDSERCRPFNAERNGTVAGEGAAFAVIESERHRNARSDGKSLAVMLTDGWSCDGYHITAPDPGASEGYRAMAAAMDAAAVEPGGVACVVAHGTGTRLNDQAESLSLQRLFGELPTGPWIVAPKAKLGHGGGASGAFGFLTGALIAHHQMIPPAYNLQPPDPECRLRFNTCGPLPENVRHVMVNSYAFGGNNISVLLGRTDEKE